MKDFRRMFSYCWLSVQNEHFGVMRAACRGTNFSLPNQGNGIDFS